MRCLISLPLLLALAGPALSQTTELNHLDCIPDPASGALVCPPIAGGRGPLMPPAPVPAVEAPVAPAAVVPVPAPAPSVRPSAGKTAKGTPEWNAQCAAKYKSFDPATGMYKGYSGVMKPCL